MDALCVSSLELGSGRDELCWGQWLRGLCYQIYEVLTQKILSRHLQDPLPLPALDGVTCIVTGSTSGIGLEIARQLAVSGAHVVMAVRNPAAASHLIQKWRDVERPQRGLLNVEVMELDLLSLGSVVKFAKSWNSRSKPLNILINNAGIFSMGKPQEFSRDGYETHLQVNHLAPALLSLLLLPSLLRGSPSRIINVNSTMHFLGFVDAEDMNFASGKRKFSSLKAYSSSKLAQVMFSSTLQNRLPEESRVNVACVSPGGVLTNVVRDLPKTILFTTHTIAPLYMLTPQQGSRSALFAATDPNVLDHYKALRTEESPVCAYISAVCRPIDPCREAHNITKARGVWERTLAMVGLPSDAMERLLNGEEIRCKYKE